MTVTTCSCHPGATGEWIVLRCLVSNKSSIKSFIVKYFKESCSNGLSVYRYLSTVATAQITCIWVVVYVSHIFPFRTGRPVNGSQSVGTSNIEDS